jgi:SAM-dependent methyltransferase
VISTPPRPDESDEPDMLDDSPESDDVQGSAGRAAIAADEVDRASRTYWEAEADAYQAEHGAFLMERSAVDPAPVIDPVHGVNRVRDTSERAGAQARAREGAVVNGGGFVWGPEGLTEAEAGLLGSVDALVGARVLEVGCGAAQCSRWLAEHGVHAVGIDIAVAQLRHARPAPAPPGSPAGSRRASADHVRFDPTGSESGPSSPDTIPGPGRGAPVERGRVDVVAATATALPLRDASFDMAFASYGALQFVADLPRLLAEVRRVLRPGGRWVFSVTHPIRWAFPDDPGPAGLTASGSYFDRTPYVERDRSGTAVYAEFHRTLGDYVAALTGAGFALDRMVEPEWPDWNDATWGGWSPLRGTHLPGTLIIGCRADGRAAGVPPV